MRNFTRNLFLFVSLFATVNAFASTNKYWIGAAGDAFNNNAKWSLSSNGPNNTTAPGVGDIAIFDGGKNTNCAINAANVTVDGIQILAGYTQTISRVGARTITISAATGLTISGTGIFDITGGSGAFSCTALTMSAGQFKAGNNTHTFSGAVNISGGTFTAANSGAVSSLITFNGAFSQTAGTFAGGGRPITANSTFAISGTAAFTKTSNTLAINNSNNLAISGGTFTGAGGTLTVTGNVVFSAGSFIGAAQALNVTGNWNQTGGTYTGPVAGGGTIAISGTMSLATGTFTQRTNPLSVTSTYSQSSGTFTGGNATITIGSTFTLSGTASFTKTSASMDINGSNHMVITGGTFTGAAGALNVTGDWNQSGGTYTGAASGGGNITISGSMNLSVGTFTQNSNPLAVSVAYAQTSGIYSGGTASISIGSTFTLSGTANFTSTSGTLTITNVYSNTATFNDNGGTVTFSSGSFSLTGSTTFNNLVFDGTVGGTKTYTIANGTIFTVNGNLTYSGSSTLIIDSGTGEIDLNGSSGQLVNLNNTAVGGGGTALIRFTSSAIYAVQGSAANGTSALGPVILDDGCNVGFGSGGVEFISLTGDFTNNTLSGSFGCEASSTVVFCGTTTLSGTADFAFAYMVINSSSTLTATSGNFYASGDFTNDGTFIHNDGTAIFNGTSTIGGSNITSFNNFIVDGSASSVILPPAVNIAGDFTDNTTPSVFDPISNSCLITFNSIVGDQLITTTDVAATWYDVTVDNIAGDVSCNVLTDLTLHNLTLTNGSFTAPANTLTISNNFTADAVFNHNNGTVIFDGAATSIGGSLITSFYNLSIASGTLTGPLGNVNIENDWTNNAVYTHNSGTVTFDGASPQTIGGTAVTGFNNIGLSNAAGAALAVGATLAGNMAITAGDFDVNGNSFTLLSTAAATGSIDAIPAASSFIGDLTIQRYVPVSANTNDWRFLGAPVDESVVTIAQWADDFATSGFTGATCGPTDCGVSGCGATCNYPSIYWYDESQPGNLDNFGYTAVTNITNPIVKGRGYWVYLGPTPVTFAVTGAPYQQAESLPVTYNNSGDINNDGWNQVANPYPCTIDWDAASDATHWTKTNLDATVYVYNSSTGSYASYVAGSGGVGVNGGTNLIASQQAFWVKANGGGAPVLTAREQIKNASSGNPTYFRATHSPNESTYPLAFTDYPVAARINNITNSIRLTAKANVGGRTDETFIRFMSSATDNFDGQYDGWKLINPDTLHNPNFSSVITGNKDLCINSMPSLTTDVAIPLRLKIPKCNCTRTYSISRDSILMLPKSSCIILEDKKTGSMIDLATVITYTFTIKDTTKAPRFILHISAPITKKAINATCATGTTSNGMAIAKGTGAGPWNYIWKNSVGATVKTTTSSSSADTLFNCAAGTYSVNVTSLLCGTVTDTIVVQAPPVLTSSLAQNNVSCFSGNNGSVSLSTSGGVSSYTYHWGTGETTASISGLVMGNYSVLITDGNGCAITKSVTITQPAAALTNSVSATSISCFGNNNGSATVSVSGGTPSYLYLWDGGATTPAISNLSVGNYSITVTDSKGCTQVSSVSVTQPAALTNTVSQTDISCYGGTNGTALVSVSGGTASYTYAWNSGASTSAISGVPTGTYSVVVTDAKGCTSTASATLTQPAAALTTTVSQTNVSCFGANDGSAIVIASGGTPAYAYIWNNGQSVSSVSNLPPGNYSFTITDAKGCSTSTSTSVSQPSAIIAGFNASSYTVDIATGTSITFTNGSSGAVSYQWDFGDTSGVNIAANPKHVYAYPGTYSVSLVAFDNNNNCSDTIVKKILVVNSNLTGLNENNTASSVSVIYDKGEVYLQFSLDEATSVEINVYNMVGAKILSFDRLFVKNERIKLDFPSSSAGIYIAVSEMKDAVISKKIILPLR